MARMLTCPKGHQWLYGDAASRGGQATCPVCGSSGVTLPPPDLLAPTEDAQTETFIHEGPPVLLAAHRPPSTAEGLHPSRALSAAAPPSSAPPSTAEEPGGDTLMHSLPPAAASQPPGTLHPPSQPPPHEHCPSVSGYEIEGLLGRGGMGVVYKARHLQLKRLVALKMILAGPHADPETLLRFRTEAEAVARLHHPNIVQIYEVGEHQGTPYLTLEFVEGGTLDRKLHGTPQPARDAAALLETLAHAVHHAHQQGVVHRDLKPANILLALTGAAPANASDGGLAGAAGLHDCFPKITDFGLAKRLEGESSQTRTGALLGTPSYMAPEQADCRIDQVGPPADTYALGAILYELLTGRPPFKAAVPLDTVMQVVHEDPVPPRQLNPSIDRDLETVCLKCLEKDPARRYESALALAEDLGRFLRHEPIRARPAGAWERAVKWARRRPALAALVGVIVVAALGLLLAGTWFSLRLRHERDVAQRERDIAMQERHRAQVNVARAMRAIDQMLTEVAEEDLAHVPRMEEKRKALLKKALAFYNELFKEESDDPAVRKETALAHKRLGDVLRLLGSAEESQRAYHQAIELLDRLAQEDPGEPAYRHGLAESWNWLGEALRPGDPVGAEKAYRRAAALQQELAKGDPEDPDYPRELARTHSNLGLLFHGLDRPVAAERSFTLARKLLQGRFADRPKYRQELAKVYLNLGEVLRALERPVEAATVYDSAIGLLEDLAAAEPDVPDYRLELAVACNNLGILNRSTGAPDTAKAANEKALGLLEALHRDFPKVVVYRKELAIVCNSLALALADPASLKTAEKYSVRSQGLLEGLLAEHKDDAEIQGRLGMTLGTLGWLRQRQAGDPLKDRPRLEEGCRTLEDGLAQLRDALRARPDQPVWLRALREQYGFLARGRARLGDHAAATRATAELVAAPLGHPREAVARALRDARTVQDVRDLAAADPRLPAAQRTAVLGDYADQFLELCRQALAVAACHPDASLRAFARAAGKK